MSDRSGIILGIDLGRTTVSLATGEKSDDGVWRVVSSFSRRHFGRPLDIFVEEYGKLDRLQIHAIASTGIYGGLLAAPVLSGVPGDVAQAEAARRLYPGEAVNVFRLGGGGYSILTIDADGRASFHENDKCSAGTGEMIEKICDRLGLTIDEAVELAGRAESFIPITSRCSVFAQTEITHYANQGEPRERLLAGYFRNVARSLFALYNRHRVEGRVVMIGHGALIEPIRRIFEEFIGRAVEVLPEAPVFDALGAMYNLAGHGGVERAQWPEDASELFAARKSGIETMAPADQGPGSVVRLGASSQKTLRDEETILGLDLGSTGAKAVLLGRRSGALIADVYEKTLGNPVEAARSLVKEILERDSRPIASVAFTGSGREAAASVFRASLPEAADRTWVLNEIVAHATAAASMDPDGGRSLTVVEIGGQDAKFINVQDGMVASSNLNCACSAGTGAFLEEQANFHGVTDLAEFARIAGEARRIPDLGQMCSVFVADLAVEAGREGFARDEVFAGLLRSVIVNYQNRVMGHRPFLDRVFFQGKPAQNPVLARTLASVAGREILVPENPGAMGAIGAAIMAREKLGDAEAPAIEAEKYLSTTVSSRRSFNCPDIKCGNSCRLEEAVIVAPGSEIKVISGGACPRYDASGGSPLPGDAPRPYRERRELLDLVLADGGGSDGGPIMGIPHSLSLVEHLPFFHRYFSRLGIGIKLLASDSETLHRGNSVIGSQGTCTPAKLMHGLAMADVEFLFVPQIVSYRGLVEGLDNKSCPLIHSVSDMISGVLSERRPQTTVVTPVLGFTGPAITSEIFEEMDRAARIVLGAKLDRAKSMSAFAEAVRAQEDYEKGLMEIGRRAMAYGREKGTPLVLVAGNYYVIHEPVMSVGIHNIIAREGAIPLPLDCFPVAEDVPPLGRIRVGLSRRVLRASIGAAMAGGIYPLILASHGCGPMAFTEHLFNELMENHPHTLVESDGHGGRAGYVTRVQAFLHSAKLSGGDSGRRTVLEKAQRYETQARPSREELKKSKLVVFGAGPGGGNYSASIKRARGFDADPAAPKGEETLRIGRMHSSGKECLPHALIWGSFAQYLERHRDDVNKPMIVINITGEGPCNNAMFNLVNEINLEKMGLGDRVKITGMGSFQHDPAASSGGWINIVGIDILNFLRGYYRPDELEEGQSDRLFAMHAASLEESLLPPRAGTGPIEALRNIGRGEAVIRQAAKDFLAMPKKGRARLPVVYLCGDIYLRLEQAANDDIVRKLNDLGLRVIVQPAGEIFEVLLAMRSSDLLEMETGFLKNRIVRAGVENARARMVRAARELHPWIHWESTGPIFKESAARLNHQCFFESIATIGGSIHAWKAGGLDGILVISPWGCAPAHVAEAQLSRLREIPWLFLYHDGGPIDENKLAAFAWRLRQKP